MPTYRKLHTKILDSADFAEMPDDFIRLFWVLLPLRLDSAGRAIGDPRWLRSMLFPLRDDVTVEMITDATDWLSARGMIRLYEVCGRPYLDAPTFSNYQSGTDRESPSVLPSFEMSQQVATESQSLATNSVAIENQSRPIENHSRPDADAYTDANADTNADAGVAPDAASAPVLSETVNLPEEPKAKPEPAKTSKAAVHPALAAWQNTHEGKFPNKTTWQTIISAVGDEPECVQRWQDTIQAYIEQGWSPVNIAGMLEFYKRGELPSTRPKASQNGKPDSRSKSQKNRDYTDYWNAKLAASQRKGAA